MSVFAVTTVKGPAWDATRGRREQAGWDAHATFMDALVDAGLVILGGPIGDGEDVLLVFEAEDERALSARLADDPWQVNGMLAVGEVRPWTIWLDGTRRGRAG